jgi:hypothetical protein
MPMLFTSDPPKPHIINYLSRLNISKIGQEKLASKIKAQAVRVDQTSME